MRYRSAMLLALCCLAVARALAEAQTATTTYVSGLGNDANPCTRTAPCATFATALTKTVAGGEIRALDAGVYATQTLTITKAITIDGGDAVAALTVVGNAIVVNAGTSDIVILRNLTITGPTLDQTAQSSAIRFASGRQLIVEGATVNCDNCRGVEHTGSAQSLVVKNSTLTAGGGFGVVAFQPNAYVTHTVITGFGCALCANGRGVINADSNILTGNNVAVQAVASPTGNATVRLSNNQVYNNRTGFGCGGGVLASAGNNRKGGNVGGTASCSPTVVITQQ